MKNRISKVAQWMGRLMLVVSLVAFSAGAAMAWNINGTVTNNTGRTGRVYLYLQQYGDTGLGVSIPATAPGTPFTIRGVPNGNYTLKAFVDGSGTGLLHANDPTWSSSGTITINNGDYSVDSNSTVVFNSLPNVTPQMPAGAMIIPGDNGAFVGWDTPQSNGIYNADSYRVYYSTTASPTPIAGGAYVTVPAGDRSFAIFHYPNGTPLYIQVTALVGTTESTGTPPPVASATINPPAAGFSISGTINLSGITPPSTAILSVALIDPMADGPPSAVAWVASPPQLTGNNFTINANSTKVPNGTYVLLAFIDMNGDGRIGSGDIMLSDQQAPAVTINGSNVTLGQPITLSRSNSTAFLNTTHWQDINTPPNDSYQITVGAQAMLETITNITVTGGPGNNGLSYPIDLGINSWGQFQAWLNVNNNRPLVAPTPDTYNLNIQYANGVGPDTVNLPVTAVLDSFATPTAPVGNLPWSAITNPSIYSWTAPTSPPTPSYTYSFWTSANNFNGNNNLYNQMPSTTTSLSLPGLTYNDGNRYYWNINVQDSFGNQAQKSAWVSYTSGPAIDSFTPTTVLPGDTVTIYGMNFNTTAGNNRVNFGCGAQATAATATAAMLTVVVPSNACTSFLQVQNTSTGKTSQNSATQLNVLQTLQVAGQVTDATTMYIGINSANVSANFTVNSTPHTVNTTTNSGGNYSLPGVPQNTDITLSFAASGYATAYTGTINTGNYLYKNMALYPIATFNTWNGGDSATGVIRGRVFEQSNGNGILGATVTASGYTIIYDDGSGNMGSGTSTAANGVFYITHVSPGATVTITTEKTGYFITSPVSAAGHAGAITNVDVPGFPLISITGSVVNSSNTAVPGATIEQVGAANSSTSTAGGTFTINGIPGGNNFELKVSLSPTYVPTYGWLNSPSNLTLLYPYILYTPTELSGVLGITAGKGAIIGRVVNNTNPAAAISGATVTIYGPSPSYTIRYFNSATGLFSSTTATDASGLFLVKDVEDGANISVNASVGTSINGNTNFITHANAVSEIMVPCNVPTPGWGNLQLPGSITVTPNQTTENIYGQVYQWGVTDGAAGPATGLVAELGYGPQGTSPTNPAWAWKLATYNAQLYSSQVGNNVYQYATTLTVPTAGSYDYVYRYSYYGGQYTYADLNGVVYGTPFNPGKLAVNGPSWSIAGHVTDTNAIPGAITGVGVSIFNSTNLQFLGGTTTDMSGNYSVGNLAAGSYKVQFIPPSFTGYDNAWYTGKHDSATADTIVLTDPGVYTADASLTYGLTGTISGRVTDGVNGIAGVWVGVNVASNMAFVYGATTDANGYYSIGGLVTGDYKVYFAGNSVGYQNIWYNASLSPNTATTVPITAPNPAVLDDTVLTRAGAISGKVTTAALVGISNVLVNVSDAANGNWLANAMTNGSGDYTVSGLAAGTYKVSFDGSSVGYGRQWYDTKTDIASANPVTVYIETTTPGINGVLPVAGSITGRVTAATVGLPGVSVTVYDAATGVWITNTMTNASGNYIVNGLPTGSYKLQYNKNGYVGQWYLDKTSKATADPVSVTAPGATSISDVALQAPSISGFVYSTVPLAIQGATVTVVGNPSLTAITAADGSYTINGIPLNLDFQIKASMAGYVDAYSATFNTTGNNINARELILFTSTEVSDGITPTTGGIFGQTLLSGLRTPLDGVTVSIVSSTGGPYTVLYDNGSGSFTPVGPTSTNGRFFIPNITDGDTVVLSATKPGWNLNGPKTYVVHANAVTEGSLVGNYTTTTSVSLASGTNPTFYGGEAPTFTATVVPSTASGTVQFKVDGVNVGTPVALVSGSATSATISVLTLGAHTVTAVFTSTNGSGYAGSTSTGTAQTVIDRVMIINNSSDHFLTLDAANLAAVDGKTLLLRNTHFKEELTIDYTPLRPSPLAFTITLKGGLDSDFATPQATATSARKLTIKNGKVISNRFVVKPD